MDTIGVRRISHVDGVALHWCELGAGPPVVLLHGLSDCLLTWRAVAPRLAAAGHRVLLVDLPGHGLSGRPDASYALEWHAGVIGAWLDALGVDRFHLVGHSYGGGVAQQLLLSHGARVDGLALIAPGGLGREVSVAVRALAVPGVHRLLQPFLQLGTRLVLRALPRVFAEVEHRRWHAWQSGAPGTARALARTTRDVVDLRGQKRSLYERLGELDLPPVALYWGRRDRVLPVTQVLDAVQHLPGARVRLFDRCGHFPHLEDPDAFTGALLDFLAEARPPTIVAELLPAPRPRRWLRAAWRTLLAALRSLRRHPRAIGAPRVAEDRLLPEPRVR